MSRSHNAYNWPWWRFIVEFLYRDLQGGLVLLTTYLLGLAAIAAIPDAHTLQNIQRIFNVGIALLVVGGQIVAIVETRKALTEWQEKQILLGVKRDALSAPPQTGDPTVPKALAGDLSEQKMEAGEPAEIRDEDKPKLEFHIGMPQYGRVGDVDAILVWIQVINAGARVDLFGWRCTATVEQPQPEQTLFIDGEGTPIQPGKGVIATRHPMIDISEKDFLQTRLKDSSGIDRNKMQEGWIAFGGFERPEIQIYEKVDIFCRDAHFAYQLTAIQRHLKTRKLTHEERKVRQEAFDSLWPQDAPHHVPEDSEILIDE